MLSVHRQDYHDALKAAALDQSLSGPVAKIRYGCKVESYDPVGGSVTLASGEKIHGDLIVAADGVRSRAHEWIIGEKRPAPSTGINNVRFCIEAIRH